MIRKKITIAVVCFNAVRFIDDLFISLHKQKKDLFELVIIDGGSKDGTLELIQKHKDIVDILISERDNGIYDAMNKALSNASGEWLLFLGADDVLLANLEDVLSYFEERDVVYYGDCLYSNSKRIYDGKFNKFKIFYKNICHQGIFYPKTMYRKMSYNCNYPIRADHAYNITGYFKFKYKYIPVIVAKFNERGLSSRVSDQNFQRDRLVLYKNEAPSLFFLAVYIRYLLVKLHRCLFNE